MKPLSFYQVLDSSGEVLGTYWSFKKAKTNKPKDGSIKFWTGKVWVLNVTEVQE